MQHRDFSIIRYARIILPKIHKNVTEAEDWTLSYTL